MLGALTLAMALSADPGIHLDASPHRARILLAEMMTPDQIAESPIDRLSLSQLRLEERRLTDPPTTVVPILMMCLGGTGLVGGGLSTYYLFSQLQGSGLFGIVLVFFGIVTAAVAIIGAAALVAGVVLLPQRQDARASYLDRAAAVRARIGAIEAGSAIAPPEPESPQVTQLNSDVYRLEQDRPGIGLPIGLMAGGAGVGVYTASLFLSGSGSGSTGSLTAIGIGGAVIALALEGIGIYLLIDRLNTRAEIDAKLNELRNGAPPGQLPEQAPPGGDVVPPPPPPPPPTQVNALPPLPLFAVATFQF